MKEGWAYKKLGEVCDIYQPKTISAKELVDNGEYLVYGANGVIGRYNSYNHENSEVLMTCRGATCGTINISEPYSWINGNAMVIHPKDNNITQTFLLYHLRGIDLSDVITGAAQPQITRQSLSPKMIFIPPLAEQERIVAELDLLSSIIEKKKAQLKELDQLAQSIFYDMFGDPITNEKGWEVQALSTVCDVRDGTHDSPKYVDNGYPLITSKNVVNGTISFDNVNLISERDLIAINARSKVDDGDIIMPMIGTIGKPTIVIKTREFAIKNVALIKFSEAKRVLNIYIQKLLDSESYSRFIKEQNRGGTQKFISLGMIRKLPTPLPPLSLQQEFAEKVEAIERQKALVQQSIAETQTLFDSRMDHWFS